MNRYREAGLHVPPPAGGAMTPAKAAAMGLAAGFIAPFAYMGAAMARSPYIRGAVRMRVRRLTVRQRGE